MNNQNQEYFDIVEEVKFVQQQTKQQTLRNFILQFAVTYILAFILIRKSCKKNILKHFFYGLVKMKWVSRDHF